MTYLPKVHHAALEHRGIGRQALLLRFERPLDADEQMAVLAEVGFFRILSNGAALLPVFPEGQQDIVLLTPAIGQEPGMNGFKAAASHFGFISPEDGELPFIQEEGHPHIKKPSRMEH